MNTISKEMLIELIISKYNFYKELHLIDNFELIKKFYNKLDLPKIFYFNAEKIHKILYECNEIIELNSNLINEENLSLYYYLVSLIIMDRYTINYKYNFDCIQKIVNQNLVNQNQSNKNINVIIKAKEILDLIENFKGFYEGKLEDIDKIVEANESLISNNIQCLKGINSDMTENYIKYKNINEIYTDIIISLIKNDKLADFKYASDIMDEMEMENIDINESMYKKLECALNSIEINNKYGIENLDDVNNLKKINFHYILLKKILKNSIYIYQIKFLFKTSNNIKNILKQENIIFNINENNDEINRMEYIIKKYCDSDYYFINFENNISTRISDIYSRDLQKKKASKENIIEFEKIIGNHEETANEIKELKNGFFASFGIDKKLIIYDKNFSVKYQRNDIDDRIHHVLEIESQENNQRYIKLLLCTYNSLYLYQINLENNRSKIKKIDDCGGVMILEIKNNNNNVYNYIICNEKGISKYSNLFSDIFLTQKESFGVEENLHKKYFRGGYALNNNLVAFSSNKDSPRKKNRLIFYNINSKEIIKKIKDNNNEVYSFIKSSNGFLLIKDENKSLKKIFLAACKKYIDNQKNGILTVVSLFDETETDEMSENFVPTDDFEVYCFCQLSKVKDTGRILDKKKFIKTNYFLVGGYDKEAKCGLIKLYKAKFDRNSSDTNIEYAQDITLIIPKNERENNSNNEQLNESNTFNEILGVISPIKQSSESNNTFNGFSGAITSIIQSSLTGNISATCQDGNVYLFTPPNLENYL